MHEVVSIYPLVFAEFHFIHKGGYVFIHKSKNQKVKLQNELIDDNIYVTINNKKYLLLDLMLEYFFSDVKDFTSLEVVKAKNKSLTIPVSHITFKNEPKEDDLDYLVFKYNVKIRVRNANDRCISLISTEDVVSILKSHKFACRYCGVKIHHTSWHLDHIKPIYLNGENKRENLAPACKMCNLMKGYYNEESFLMKCYKITQNRKDTIDEVLKRSEELNKLRAEKNNG